MINSAQQYTWVRNAADLDISGNILPIRDIRGDGSNILLKKEDMAYILEAFGEKTLERYSSYSSHFSKTVNCILHGNQVYQWVQIFLDNFIFANSNNQDSTFVKQAYQFTDPSNIVIDYTSSNTAPIRFFNDLYPDCWMVVDYMTKADYRKLTWSYNTIRKGDLFRKLYYFLKQSDWMTTTSKSYSCSATCTYTNSAKLNQGIVELITEPYTSTSSLIPSYTLQTYSYTHGDYKGLIYEKWYDNLDMQVTVKGKFKSLKVLLRNNMVGNLEDTQGITTKIKKVSFQLIDLEKVDNDGSVWRIPSQYINGAALKQRAIDCGFTQLATMSYGNSTRTSGSSAPNMTIDSQILQFVGELDAKTTLQDVNWVWTP